MFWLDEEVASKVLFHVILFCIVSHVRYFFSFAVRISEHLLSCDFHTHVFITKLCFVGIHVYKDVTVLFICMLSYCWNNDKPIYFIYMYLRVYIIHIVRPTIWMLFKVITVQGMANLSVYRKLHVYIYNVWRDNNLYGLTW